MTHGDLLYAGEDHMAMPHGTMGVPNNFLSFF